MDHLPRLTILAFFAYGLASADPAGAVTLWTENAENGLIHVIDNTDTRYPLIQSDVVGQGDFAFHLANPDFQDNSFEIDRTISIEADTRLFFLSQLRYATPSQVARVEISTNGGGTWTTSVFDQPGSDSPGEGAFSLQTIELGNYANQDLRFRFLYDFTGGFAYTQTDSQVGWFVDDIQIGSQFEKSLWSIGDPTAHEQHYLEYANRARADALAEAARLRDETDPEVQDAYRFFDIDGQDIVEQFTWNVENGFMDRVAQPLSFQSDLQTAAQLHAQDMFENEFQGHNSSNNPPAPFGPGFTFGDRLDAVRYQGAAGENVFSAAESVAHGHTGFDVDWGDTSDPSSPAYNPAFNGQGMQNPAGHRLNIHNGGFKEAGIGVVNGTNGSVGPQVVTQDFGDPGDVSYVTGVVFEDLNANEFYDVGEGRSGVRIDVDGSAFYALSSESGGYSVPVRQDGSYSVTFSGGGFATYLTDAVVAGGNNVKVDYLVSALMDLLGDYNGNGRVEQADLDLVLLNWGAPSDTLPGAWVQQRPSTGIVDQAELDGVLLNWGRAGSQLDGMAAVPEPSTLLLAIAIIACCTCHGARRRTLRRTSPLLLPCSTT